MSDIPSDFDPSVLFSDYLPSTQPEEYPSLPSPPEESHSDELEALELVVEETRQRCNREGVVIRHRQLNPKPAFRSSSLPPGEFDRAICGLGLRYALLQQVAFSSNEPITETPTRNDSKRQIRWNLDISSPFRELHSDISSPFQDLCSDDTVRQSSPVPRSSPAPQSSPTTPRASAPRMTFESSMLSYPHSSPPLQSTSPPAKRQKTASADSDDGEAFNYPDSDEEAIANEGWDHKDEEESPPGPIGQKKPELALTGPPAKPDFNRSLTGGMFSKKFTPANQLSFGFKAPGRDLVLGNSSPTAPVLRNFRASLTPPPRLPSPDPDSFERFQSAITPAAKPKAFAAPSPPISSAVTPAAALVSTYLPVVTSSGETFRVRQKPPRIYSTRDTSYMTHYLEDAAHENNQGAVKKSYYGVEISTLLDDYKAEKRITKAKKQAEASKAADEAIRAALLSTVVDSGLPPKPASKTLLWSEKYRAKRFTDLVGDERTHRQVLRWFKCWDKIVFPSAAKVSKKKDDEEEGREMRKILLIHGPPGLGKTTLAHVAAKQAGYEVVEVNASDERSAVVVEGRVRDILSNEGVKSMGMKAGGSTCVSLGKPVCLVVDEIDGVTGGGASGEGGFVKALIDLVLADQKANNFAAGVTRKRKGRKGDLFRLQRPIVAICNDLYAPALRALRPLAEIVHMRKPPAGQMVGRLKSVLTNEGFRVEDGAVRRLVELSCMGEGAGSSKAGGDMRAAMVGCEWIACRLRAAAEEDRDTTKSKKEKRYLTRKIVEEEFGDGGLGDADGKGGGGGRGNVREAVERVFYQQKEASNKGKSAGKKSSSMDKLRVVVEGLGEFDKIITDCFTTYPTRPFHDDPFLTKPNAAYEWLWFSDLLSTRVFQEQAYELSGYLSSPILAFHHLFSSATRQKSSAGKYNNNKGDDGEEEEEAPFTGPQAEWEVRERTKENKALIQTIHTGMNGGIRLHQAFKSAETVAMELAPWVSKILAPNIKPIVVGGSGPEGGVASVRREGEKKLVARGVEVMVGLGIEFERVKVEGIGGGGNWGWVYRMEP